jgi:hypothetical protein
MSFFILKPPLLNGEDPFLSELAFGVIQLIGLCVVSADLRQPATDRQG